MYCLRTRHFRVHTMSIRMFKSTSRGKNRSVCNKHAWSAFSLLLAAYAGSTEANAATYWSAISTGCIPDAASIQANRYASSSDSVIKHRGTNVQRIVLICSVSPNDQGQAPNVLTMTYRDSTATGAKAYVRAQLISVSRASGARVVVTTVSSNSSSVSSVSQLTSAPFSHVLDFNTSYYFVKIEMDRSTSSQTVSTVGVALDFES